MSSKTHTGKDAKTGWVHNLKAKLKDAKLSGNLTLIVASVILLVLVIKLGTSVTKRLIINDHKFYAKVVSTPKAREKGLSGKNSLGSNQAMLFEYSGINASCMWMKDMKFNIDIVWLDSNKQVVDYKKSATPESYPETFCSKTPAQFVLELPDGSVSRLNIDLGSKVIF